ncbi:MAG TPA: hypothetical protein VEW94_04910 [Chloroflexia bacterium]|nr:hypothetical protein [Chloroflexia bacterium]
MTEQELREIRERANQAWPGPWVWDEQGYLHSTLVETDVPFEDVRDFIAHARTDIPTLIGEVERLQAENKELREFIENVMRER